MPCDVARERPQQRAGQRLGARLVSTRAVPKRPLEEGATIRQRAYGPSARVTDDRALSTASSENHTDRQQSDGCSSSCAHENSRPGS